MLFCPLAPAPPPKKNIYIYAKTRNKNSRSSHLDAVATAEYLHPLRQPTPSELQRYRKYNFCFQGVKIYEKEQRNLNRLKFWCIRSLKKN